MNLKQQNALCCLVKTLNLNSSPTQSNHTGIVKF